MKDGTGNISTADLEEGLRQLKVFDGMSKEQAFLATRRFDQNGDGTVSLCDFLAFAGRPYAANDRPLEAKLRRVLLKAEAVRERLGALATLDGVLFLMFVFCFCGLVKNGGRALHCRSTHIGVDWHQHVCCEEYLAVEARDRQPFTMNHGIFYSFRSDRPHKTTGAITTRAFFFFYHVQKVAILNAKANSNFTLPANSNRLSKMGTSMEEAFKHFDKDGCGSITAQGFSTGLREMGVFQEFSQEEVDQVRCVSRGNCNRRWQKLLPVPRLQGRVHPPSSLNHSTVSQPPCVFAD